MSRKRPWPKTVYAKQDRYGNIARADNRPELDTIEGKGPAIRGVYKFVGEVEITQETKVVPTKGRKP